MANIISLEKISLKNHPEIKEDHIQKYIFDHPEVLGLGELIPIRREKIQPSGGRLDLLLSSGDGDTRYEVEIMLGATDPSHIIRTIEYWDSERKIYPQYDHCAVIVAEEITGRFMNVINLFNGAIPLIALQMSAHKVGDNISLEFTKVIDRIVLGTDEDDEVEIVDRSYWEKHSTKSIIKVIDDVFADLSEFTNGYELKYNKHYIGISKNGSVKNFIYFRPKKQFFHLYCKTNENAELASQIEDSELDYTYESRQKQYKITLHSYDEYKAHERLIKNCVKNSMDYFNLLEI